MLFFHKPDIALAHVLENGAPAPGIDDGIVKGGGREKGNDLEDSEGVQSVLPTVLSLNTIRNELFFVVKVIMKCFFLLFPFLR